MAGVDALKSNRMVASSTAVSALTPFSSLFSLKSTFGVRFHACGHPRSIPCRSHTTATSVTTVPRSVCYGALNLLVCMDASNFIPYACEWAVTGGVRGSRSTAPSTAISGGSVAAERSYRTSETLAPVFPVLGLA